MLGVVYPGYDPHRFSLCDVHPTLTSTHYQHATVVIWGLSGGTQGPRRGHQAPVLVCLLMQSVVLFVLGAKITLSTDGNFKLHNGDETFTFLVTVPYTLFWVGGTWFMLYVSSVAGCIFARILLTSKWLYLFDTRM